MVSGRDRLSNRQILDFHPAIDLNAVVQESANGQWRMIAGDLSVAKR